MNLVTIDENEDTYKIVLSPVDTSKVTTLIIMFNASIDFDQISMNAKTYESSPEPSNSPVLKPVTVRSKN
ncbi:unnamed protein product [Rhizophagus irregularis]|nr:unnamed protein product [Rhizophagus irregularis]